MTSPVIIGDATLYLGLAVVVLGVGRPRHNFQILNPVVGLVAVLVVDDLVATKRPSKVALHHNAMFATAGVRPVPFRSQRDVAVGVVRLAPRKCQCPSPRLLTASRCRQPQLFVTRLRSAHPSTAFSTPQSHRHCQ